jgi:hypothetical protein
VVSFKPAPGWSLDWAEEYDTRAKTTTRRDLRVGLGGSLGRLRANWTRQPEIRDIDGQTVLLAHDEAVGGQLDLLPSRGHLELSLNAQYSLVQKIFINRSLNLRLNGQCLGVTVGYMERQLYLGQKPIRSFGFSLELANLGSIGMDPRSTGGSLGSPRGF